VAAAPAPAQTAPAPPAAPGPASPPDAPSAPAAAPETPEPSTFRSLGFRGALIYKNYSHVEEAGKDGNFRNEGILRLEWERRLAPWLALKAVGEARGDDDDFTDGVYFEVPETNRRRSILNLREAVVRLGRDAVEVSLGKQFYTWGTGDVYNPTDLINPYDTLDPIDIEKMAVYSAALRVTHGPASLVFVVVPVFTPTRDPLPGSRWAPRATPSGAAILDDREIPGPAFDAIQYAARGKVTLGGFDVSLSYFEGFERTPVLQLSSVPVLPGVSIPRITPVFTRIRAPGADVSTTWRRFEFHAEMVARLVVSKGRDDRLQTIGGFNHTWDDFDLSWLQNVSVGVEYAKEVILHRRDPSPFVEPPLSAGLGEDVPFRDALIGRLHLKFSEDTSLRTAVFFDFSRSTNAFAQIKVTHKLTDALLAEAGLDGFFGARDTAWGRWRDNNRFFATLQYLF
jgi:hypothetical protein